MSKGQYVIRHRGYYVVLTRIGRQYRDNPDQRWEIEVTSPRRRTSLHYRRSLRLALRFIIRKVRSA